ncbi:hypothetical protein DW243_19135, partial [Mediterraneibacter gnavus]
MRQAFNIQKAYANGVFQLEPKRKETLYDRCYVFEDINYINKNRTEKKNFLSELMFWLNSMDASYKITLCNEYQSVEKFLASIRNERNERDPKNVRQAFNIQKAYANGVFQLETKKKDTLYDRCYVFEDINYINKNRTEKKNFLSELMFWLNSMDASYKITLCNEYQSVEKFLASIRNERNEREYPDIAKGIRQWQESKLADANSTVRTLRYLTITCRADSLAQANIYFRALEPMIEDAFAGWGSDIAVLGTLDRFRVLHGMLRPGEEFPQVVLRETLQDWKSDVLPRSIQQFNDYLILGNTMMTVLTATQYRKSLDTDTFLHTLSSLPYPSFVTLDFAPVQQEVINDKLVAMHMNNEREINDEIEQKRQAGQIVTSPSYTKKKRRDEIEEYIEMVDANDEKGVFLNLLVVLTAPVKEGVELLQ